MEGTEIHLTGGEFSLDWPAAGGPPAAMVASSGISTRLWRLYAYSWLVCLLFPLLSLVQAPPPPARLFGALAGLAVFVVAYFLVMWPHPLDSGARPMERFTAAPLASAGLTALALLLSLLFGSAFPWLFVGASAVAGLTLPARRAFLAVMALTLLTLGLSVLLAGGLDGVAWMQIIPLVLLVRGLGLDMLGMARLSGNLRELHAARQELARQAVGAERLRMARDLHDLLGHTLSLITLKSELAGRLIPAEPARAAQEVREVENVARGALREVREAVAGYRQQTLRGALEGARQILEAAGIDCAITASAGPLSHRAEAVLAWMVREGATNVIRHSRARHCQIRIAPAGEAVLAELSDDGQGEQGRAGPVFPAGSGLAGLAERVAAVGGHFEAGPGSLESGQGFYLRVVLPGGALQEQKGRESHDPGAAG